MVIITAKMNIKTDEINTFLEITKILVEESRKEEGCIEYSLYEDNKNKNSFTFIEKWRDQEAIDFHFKTQHFITAIERLKSISESTDINFYKKVF